MTCIRNFIYLVSWMSFLIAQTDVNQWAFLKGSKTPGSSGYYGTKFVASVNNEPSARKKAAFTEDHWNDMFYIFGGYGFSKDGSQGELNDLWSFNPQTLEFTWLAGSGNAYDSGNYVDRDMKSSTSIPSSRQGAKIFYDKESSSLYIYGGLYNSEVLNDLWQFDLGSFEFTWIAGEQPGGNTNFNDSIRLTSAYSSPCGGIDEKLGSIYLFGGIENTGYIFGADFYKYNYNTKQWTQLSDGLNPMADARFHFIADRNIFVFFSGAISALSVYSNQLYVYNVNTMNFTMIYKKFQNNVLGVYTTKYVATSLGYPGSRSHSYTAFDYNTNKLYVFGGFGFGKNDEGTLNDLWVFSYDNMTWTFLSGDGDVYISSKFGDGSIFQPGGMIQGTSFYSTSTSSVFIFSGATKDVSGDTFLINELWAYKVSGGPTHSTLIVKSKSSVLQVFSYFSTYQTISETNSVNIIYIIVPLIILVVLIVCFIYFLRKSRRTNSKEPNVVDAKFTNNDGQQQTTNTLNSHPIKINNTTVLNFNNTTLFTQQQGLSIPGYLLLDEKDFEITKPLTKGGSGEVFLARTISPNLRKHGGYVVVKWLADSFDEMDEQHQAAFNQEITIMNYLKGVNNIAEFLGFCIKPCCILLRFYKEGSLEILIHSGKRISSRVIRSLIHDVAIALLEMHSREMVHLDIKPQNVLLKLEGKNLSAVLTDFGISHVVSDKLLLVKDFKVANIKGVSVVYAAPESFQRFRSRKIQKPAIVKASDVYSFATVIYECVTKKTPWHY